MLNPGASAAASEAADHEGSSTIPDMRTEKSDRPDDRGVPVESEIVEEYLQE
jgi:hypothetical protein